MTDDTALAEHAAEIRRLGKRVVGDVIEIGRRLAECKRICGHGNWLPWLDREFKWDERTARNFMSVHEMALKSENFSDLDLPISGLYLLAAPSTPAEARTTIIARAQTGESVSVAVVKRVIDSAKGRKPLSTTKPPPPAALNSKSKSGSHLPASKTHDDSAGECERLRERIAELEDEKYRLERSNLALRDEIGGGKPGLAEKLDPPLETLYEQGAANMVTMAPFVVMVAVTKLERLLVEYGIMPPSRRTEDPQGYVRLLKQRAARHRAKERAPTTDAVPEDSAS
jgi:hypothetical protein